MDELLAGLDDVDWAGLGHAYGSADDVPDLLRTLQAPGQEDRQDALHMLYASIYHQGSRYPASGAAVPFLLALAADPATPDRDDLLYLAAGMAIGFDESHLPSGVDIAGWRREVARLRAADPADEERRLDAWVEEAADPAERSSRRRHRELVDAGYLLAELAAYDAVRSGLPVVRALLTDADAHVRAAAAYAVGWFPEEAAASLPVLQALLAAETDPAVTANALVSAGLLDGRDLIPRLREHLAGTEPLPRWAAAIALLRLDVTDPSVIAELAATTVTPPEMPGPPVAFMNGDLRLYSAAAIGAMAEPPDQAVGAVLDGLSRTSDDASFPMTATALRLTFGEPSRPLPPYASLTPAQQRTVRVIAELPHDSWQWGNLLEVLRDWGLPNDRDECRAYAGLA
ncbi:HEAT repeat domain-containing protein [Actinomadura montaniterrae]|uniref:HEAT repeat domain-containing protein n=1 Tax=Actinomadura montaniterrae TaxID=1803903 RepID=A0A6L3VG33_9ACTN|nr:HEAT repeat domain-containing protein [Actinomadura montaniterrae]KAB2366227.1 HEAT repeat domain-containing protein [Actinomadura montaniterrae]